MTTQAVVAAPTGGAVAINGGFTREQVDLIKRTVAEGASDDELALFLEVSRSSGLNPFQRQIYAVMRKSKKKVGRDWVEENKMVIQTGIDGYRLIAARSGVHAGTTDAEYGPANADGYPEWARVTVKKVMASGQVAEFTATARWREYVQVKDEYSGGEKTGRQTPSGQWPKMPYLMLGKCAEALALRKAFPAELSGVYTAEEMAQADSPAPAPVVNDSTRDAPASAASITPAQRKRLFAICGEHNVDEKGLRKLMKDNGLGIGEDGEPSTHLLTKPEYEALCDRLIPGAAQPPAQDVEDADFEDVNPDPNATGFTSYGDTLNS